MSTTEGESMRLDVYLPIPMRERAKGIPLSISALVRQSLSAFVSGTISTEEALASYSRSALCPKHRTTLTIDINAIHFVDTAVGKISVEGQVSKPSRAKVIVGLFCILVSGKKWK